MKTYQLLLLSICVLSFSGCGDCFVPTPIVPNEKPIVREATIAVFNSTIDTLNNRTPVPEFNIATFRFPYSSYSSGIYQIIKSSLQVLGHLQKRIIH